MKCEICQKEFKSLRALAQHLANPKTKKSHNIKGTKDYYDKYLKKDHNEGICKIDGCDNETTYININEGYLKYCCHKCYNLDPEIIKIRIESNKTRVVSKETRKKMSIIRKIIWKDPNYKMRDPEVQRIKGNKLKKLWSERDLDLFSSYGLIWTLKTSWNMRQAWKDPNSFWRSQRFLDKVIPKRRQHCLNGHAVYMNSKIKNPSTPQVELFKIVKSIFSTAVLNYPLYRGEGKRNYSLDIAIPQLQIVIEYDGSYWHKDSKKDNIRQDKIEESGWQLIKYRNRIPTKDQLIKDMNEFLFLED
jgi:hypothetical protein